MTFSSALSNALSGMNAATTAIQVRGHNIANATTPGYARRDVELTARGPNGGVLIDVDRAEARRLHASALAAGSASAEAGARADAASALSELLGAPGQTNGLYAALSGFERTLADLAATPESPAQQQRLLSAAQTLASTFGRLGDEAQAMRVQADDRIATGTARVNDALRALDALNRRVEQGGLSPLPEERDAHLDAIAEEIGIQVTTLDDGRVRVATTGGVPLLGEAPRLLAFAPRGAIEAGQSLANGDLSGLSAGGIDLTPGAVQGVRGGQIAAAFAVRDADVPAFAARVDALAEDVAGRLASADQDAGGQGLLTVTSGPGAASSVRVNAGVDPSQGGALWRLRDGLAATTAGPSAGAGVLPGLLAALDAPASVPGATGGPGPVSASGAVERLASSLGTESLVADTRAVASGARAMAARDDLLQATGVNTDDELQAILLIEQAYAANARVVQAVSDMMQRLTEI